MGRITEFKSVVAYDEMQLYDLLAVTCCQALRFDRRGVCGGDSGIRTPDLRIMMKIA